MTDARSVVRLHPSSSRAECPDTSQTDALRQAGGRKEIRSKADLAIHGAPPLFDEPLHVGRPNIGNHEAFLARARGVLERQWLSNNGPLVREFEEAIAQRIGVAHCIAMCNGTIALEIAIRALELTGEVIVPSYTFVATAHALQWQEITPVFADIDPSTHNLDPEAVRRMITPRTTGIVGVHLWGRGAPVRRARGDRGRTSSETHVRRLARRSAARWAAPRSATSASARS